MGRTIALSLLVLSLGSALSRAQPLPVASDWIDNQGAWEMRVTAPGASATEATENAQKKAHSEVVLFLRGRHPEVTWTPSLEELTRIRVIPSRGTVETKDLGPDVGTRQWATLTVRITPANIESFKKSDENFKSEQFAQDWQQRQGMRQLTWAKLLAGLTALLLIGAAYFRLEEATKGYYTARLRVAAGVSTMVVLVVVGLLLI